MKKNESGSFFTDMAVVVLILAILAAIAIPAFLKDRSPEDSPGSRSPEIRFEAGIVEFKPHPMKRQLRQFVAEAKIDSCLPADRTYTHGYGFAPDHPCIKHPFTRERQRRYCKERLRPNYRDYCTTAKKIWAYPALLRAKLSDLIDRVCVHREGTNVAYLMRQYDGVLAAYYRAVKDRERAGLNSPFDIVRWPPEGHYIGCDE